MPEPRIVTPQDQPLLGRGLDSTKTWVHRLEFTVATEPERIAEALHEAQHADNDPTRVTARDLFETVRTEPDRTRAAVVKALREAERRMFGTTDGDLIDGSSELPAGELRRLLWLPYSDDGEPPADAIEDAANL